MDDIIDRLAAIEDILGDEYELDRLREGLEAGFALLKPGGPFSQKNFSKSGRAAPGQLYGKFLRGQLHRLGGAAVKAGD